MEHTRAWYEKNISFYKENLGDTCVNCKCGDDISYHHIVPLALGGTNRITNVVPLCNKCHSKVHGSKSIYQRELQRKGIEKAKEQGRHIGRPRIEYPEKWKEIYCNWKEKKITATEAMRILELKRTSFYKLVKMYENKQ